MQTSILQLFINKGYLKEYYSHTSFSVYSFLDTAFVAVVTSSDPSMGILLSEVEAQVIIRSHAIEAIEFLKSKDDRCLVFSEDLLKRCGSFFGGRKLKKSLDKHCGTTSDKSSSYQSLPNHIPKALAYDIIIETSKSKSLLVNEYNRIIKKVFTFGIASLVCVFIFMLGMLTAGLREQFNEKQPSIAFDKNSAGEEYSHIEADLFAPFVSVTKQDMRKEYTFDHYYLWGNTQTHGYGILKFDDASTGLELIAEDENYQEIPTKLETPVMLYGVGKELPSDFFKTADYTDPLGIDKTEIDSYSDIAIAFFEDCGLRFDKDFDSGTQYLSASLTQKTITSDFNKAVKWISLLMFGLALVLFVVTVIFAKMADNRYYQASSPLLVENIYNEKKAEYKETSKNK